MTIAETLDSPAARDPGAELLAAERNAPVLVVALECHRPSVPGCRLVLDQLDEVVVTRGAEARIERAGRTATIVVGDSKTSRQHLRFRRTPGEWRVEDLGSKNGTVVNGHQVTTALLCDGDIVEAGGAMLMFLHGRGPRYEARDRELALSAGPISSMQTLSVELERRIQQILKIAPSAIPVLVRGETGTGKELMARAIHDVSGRRGPFIPVNCGALPRDLVESELFGYRRGAFSGASEDREGLVRRAHRGTLFLDEIAELPPDSQAALLRVLQEGEVRPVGAADAVTVDVRIVAATHQDLAHRITDGRFRQDLYGRISGFEIPLPPLRQRREDLGVLIASILHRISAQPDRVTLSKAAARALFHYTWPFNVRELEQMLRAAVGLSDGGQIRLEHLPAAIRETRAPAEPPLTPRDRALREQLMELLRDAGGNVAAVGRSMGRAPIQIRRWCTRLQIDLDWFRHYTGTR